MSAVPKTQARHHRMVPSMLMLAGAGVVNIAAAQTPPASRP
jgi:hypothetical protein